MRFAYKHEIEGVVSYVKLPPGNTIVNWAEAIGGDVEYEDFQQIIRQDRGSIRDEQDWNDRSRI